MTKTRPAPRAWAPLGVAAATAIAAATLLAPPVHAIDARDTVPQPRLSRSARAAVTLSRRPLRHSDAWKTLVQAPASRDVAPVRVVSVSGAVDNPQALVGGDGVTTLDYAAGGEAPVVVLDYGKEIGGISAYDVAGSAEAPTLHASFSEALRFMTPRGDLGGFANLLFQSGAPERFETIAVTGARRYAGPLVQGGQRYQRITLSTPGTVQLRGVGFRFTGYLGTPKNLRGHFLSDDRLLNRIWYAGAWTLNLNQAPAGTAQLPTQRNDGNLIFDGAKRDRAPWTGDQLVAAPTAFHSVPIEYVRDTLALLGSRPGSSQWWTTNRDPSPYAMVKAEGDRSQPGPMPGTCEPHTVNPVCMMYGDTYSMMYVIALRNYLLYSGDKAFVRSAWPNVTRQMAWNEQYVDADGLYSILPEGAGGWNLERNAGVQTYVNGVYRQTLLAAADLGEAIGRTDHVAAWRGAADRVKTGVNAKLFNDSTGVYSPNETDRDVITQDANVQAVLSGIATGARARSVLTRMARALTTPVGRRSVSEGAPRSYTARYSPFMGSLNLQAEFEHGATSDALAYIRSFWGRMVRSDPGNVIWERPDDRGQLTSSDSAAHAWSTGPTAWLSRYVLGVEPTTDGFATWSVSPQLGDLRWAQGAVPTPKGEIEVAWKRGRARRFQLTVTAPRGTRGVVSVPRLGAKQTIALDGEIVWTGKEAVTRGAARRTGDGVQISIIPGRHTIASH